MKNSKLSILGLGLMILVSSCKKFDLQAEDAPMESVATPAKAARWNALGNWSATSGNTTHFATIADSSITSQVAASGMVLVYKKRGETVHSLPFDEGNDRPYWYHQVSKGAIRINSDRHTGNDFAGESFAYFVITPEKLAALEAEGKSRFDLLDLSYSEASALLK